MVETRSNFQSVPFPEILKIDNFNLILDLESMFILMIDGRHDER